MDSRLFAALAGCPFGGFEFCIGIYLFFGIRRRATSWLFAVHECDDASDVLSGFGRSSVGLRMFRDAVSLTNWETFGKNVVLLGLSVLVFRYRRLMVRFVSERNQWMISLYSIFLPLFWRVSVSIIFRFSISVLIILEQIFPSDGGSGRRGGAGVSYDIRT